MLMEFSVLGNTSPGRKGDNTGYVLGLKEGRLVQCVTCLSLPRFEGNLILSLNMSLNVGGQFYLAAVHLGPPSFCL